MIDPHVPSFRVALQPIVELAGATTAVPFAYEVLVRPTAAGVTPDAFFRDAMAAGHLFDVEIAIFTRAFALLPDVGARLFVNVHPHTLEHPRFAHAVSMEADALGADLSMLTVEITEHAPITDAATVASNLNALRALGVTFAVDDLGSGFSHLRWFGEIRPTFLKISGDVAASFETTPWRALILRHLQNFAVESGCRLIIEGVEHAATADAARSLGIAFAQGYHFGRPELARELRCAA